MEAFDHKAVWDELVRFAVLAPSGDNSQPWRFAVTNGQLCIFSVPDNDNPAYNYEQRGTLIAIGAAIENICIAAETLGYTVTVTLPLELTTTHLIAQLSIEKGTLKKHPLFDAISTRATNRKPYRAEAIKPGAMNALKAIAETGLDLRFTEEPAAVKDLAAAGSVNEQIVLENFRLHDYFFNHVRWNEAEEHRVRSGLYLKTLELKPPQEFFFKLVRRWSVISFFNKLGFARQVAKENKQAYAASAAIGVISVNQKDPATFVAAGRLIERVWLTAEAHGVSFQMLTGVLFFMHRIEAGTVEDFFKSEHLPLITSAYETIKRIFGIMDAKPVLMFRLGYGGQPSGRSSRLPVTL